MNEAEILERLKESVVNLDIEGVKKACQDALAQGIPPIRAITEGMAKGMDIVGQKYEAKEYFLAELIMSGEVMKEGMKILAPHLKDSDVKKLAKAVVGTVKGDLHDIGKNIFATLMMAAGFEVVDLGVNVFPEKFVEAVRNHKPRILGISALLTVTMQELETVIKELEKANLRNQVKIIVGGAPLTDEYAKKIGADAYAPDAVAGVNICKKWAEGE
ncbi:MAG: corrinoid protein [Candidatus Freyarchaeota archaeon]|nr:corrinoid protein [Candidatus Jordarchaeia archaeon]MBS7269192.1 corrinoid protein [Candidatus Jordarchaeia archaeon]